MNGWMIAGGLAGVCLPTAFARVIICATYDEAFKIGCVRGERAAIESVYGEVAK